MSKILITIYNFDAYFDNWVTQAERRTGSEGWGQFWVMRSATLAIFQWNICVCVCVWFTRICFQREQFEELQQNRETEWEWESKREALHAIYIDCHRIHLESIAHYCIIIILFIALSSQSVCANGISHQSDQIAICDKCVMERAGWRHSSRYAANIALNVSDIVHRPISFPVMGIGIRLYFYLKCVFCFLSMTNELIIWADWSYYPSHSNLPHFGCLWPEIICLQVLCLAASVVNWELNMHVMLLFYSVSSVAALYSQCTRKVKHILRSISERCWELLCIRLSAAYSLKSGQR